MSVPPRWEPRSSARQRADSVAVVDLHVQQATVEAVEVLHLSGEIDLATIPVLHNALIRFSSEHPGEHLIVDLDGVFACDDAGLGVLLGAAGRARESGGDLVVVCSDEALRSRLSRTGFDRAVSVVSSPKLA